MRLADIRKTYETDFSEPARSGQTLRDGGG
jgi:hypothetical protein